MYLRLLRIAGILCLNFGLFSGQGVVPKLSFPEVFQVEVEGLFRDELTELDASLFYDRLKNIAALFLTYRKESTKRIYDFNNNQLLFIHGIDCTVSNLTDEAENSFFPFTEDKKTKKLILGKAEELFYFTNSVLYEKEGIDLFPAYIYKATVDLPLYHLTGCNVTHIFSKASVEGPDCEDHRCVPTLVSISVICPETAEGAVSHEYNFYRFKSGIRDSSVFLPPPGVHCDMANRMAFPGLPEYFSFSYDFIEEVRDTKIGPGIFTTPRKVWYDSKLKLMRMDEFESGILLSTKIFDIYGGVAYAILTDLATCDISSIGEKVQFDQLARLPKLIFMENPTEKDAVYVGKRAAHGLEYDVWSSSFTNENSHMRSVQEFYFAKIVSSSEESKLQLSHIDISTYDVNPQLDSFELLGNAYVSVNNFRSKPKEWEAFDVSSCFRSDRRKGFRLKVTGPPVIKNSLLYENLLERMYLKIIIVTNASVIRISELQGVFDGNRITEFTGWILEKPDISGAKTGKSEPDMLTAYRLLESAASSEKLNIKIMNFKQEVKYIINSIEDREGSTAGPHTTDKTKTTNDTSSGNGLTGGALAAIVMTSLIAVVLIAWGIFVFCKKRTGDDGKPVQMDNLN